MSGEDAAQIARWRYPVPYDFYDSSPTDATAELLAATAAYYADPVHNYFAVDDGTGLFVGFGCFGIEAQVLGYDYTQADALDIGLGMRPDRTGRGEGHAFLAAILSHARALHRPTLLRATIATFNQRSARTFLRAGFLPIAAFRSQTARPIDFGIYTRKA
ncbi:MAG: GNAT family N-acetyltransferase [Caldilineaceae bacterium]|nr:GNAT family N-acetyltransferase [Caldilineaceae bacterium]